MAIDDKICMVCGKHHKYCANDVRYNKDETWRNLYCSEECRKIFGVYKDIKDGKLNGDDASKAALQIGVAKIMSINEPMRSILTSYAKRVKPAEKVAPKIEPKPQFKVEPKVQPKAEVKAQPKQAKAKPKTNNGSKPNNNKRRNNKPKND